MGHALYLVNVIGTGVQNDAYRPDVPTGTGFACLMIHEAKAKAVVLCNDDTIPVGGATGRTRLFNGLNLDDLKSRAKTTNPAAGARTAINTWLGNNGYTAIPTAPYDAGEKNADGTIKLTPAPVTWQEVVHFVARQVNSVANLDALFV